MSWRDRAACQGRDTELWYSRSWSDGEAEALAVCRGECPVRVECLAAAMRVESAYQRHGVWGGLTASQRQRLHRRGRVAA